MASYDTPGVLYDSGVLYDDVPPPPTTRKHMAKIKLGLSSLSVTEMLQLANDIKTAMTGNANFTTPMPTLAAYGTAITAAQTKTNEASAAAQAAKMKINERDIAFDALRALTNQMASYVEAASVGDEAKIQSAGMAVKGPNTPAGIPAQVTGLAVTGGDEAGELDAQWDPITRAKTYEIQTSPDPFTAASWVARTSVTRSKTNINGLTSGTKVWVRVRAVAPGGVGAWSDPAVKVVP